MLQLQQAGELRSFGHAALTLEFRMEETTQTIETDQMELRNQW